MADQDSDASIRLTGTDLFSSPIKAGSSTAAAGFGGTGSYWAYISPSLISSRVAAMEEMFQWWIIRSLKVHYVPTIGTGTAASLSLGYATDGEMPSALASPTQQQVLELNPSLLTPVWALATLEVKATGTKLYESYASGEQVDTKFQGVLAATLLGSSTSVVYGQLWLEYVIDFYQPVPLLSSVDRAARAERVSKRTALRAMSVGKEETKEPAAADDDFVEPSPPGYRPAPSSVPGASLYLGGASGPIDTPSSSSKKVPSRK
jgi:hypothetical protein